MAQRSLFFNAVETSPGVYDRVYQSSDFAKYFGSFLTNGVISLNNSIGLGVSVITNTLQTQVAVGKAIINGHLYENDAPVNLTHDLPETTLNRIDRIVLRLDLRNSGRSVLVFVKTGTPSATPQPPALQRDSLIYELSLAKILVRANTLVLQSGDLTDERMDSSVCGVANSMVTVPTEQFQQQWDTWFAGVSAMTPIPTSQKGQPNGVATLDASGKVPASQLNVTGAPDATATVKGINFLSDSVTSTLNAANGITAATPVAVKTVNDSLTTHINDYLKHGLTGTTSGSANTYTLTPSPALASYANFLRVTVIFNVANTGTSTLNISSLGAKALKKADGTAYASGELKTSTPYTFVYNGTDFIAQGEGGAGQVTIPAALSNKWFTAANMNTARKEHGGAELNGLIYAVGGNNPTVTGTVEVYDPTTNTWTNKASLLTARDRLSVSSADGKLYAIGGVGGGAAQASIEMYDPTTNTWVTKASMTTTRFNHASCEFGGKIYVSGGQTESGSYSNTCVMYDPSTNLWSNKANMSTGRQNFGLTKISNGLLAIGGYVTGAATTGVCEYYDTTANSWTNKATLTNARNRLIAVSANGNAYAIGGDDVFVGDFLSVEMYNFSSNTWSNRANMLKERFNGAGAFCKGYIYIFGGIIPTVVTTNSTDIYIP